MYSTNKQMEMAMTTNERCQLKRSMWKQAGGSNYVHNYFRTAKQ